MNVTIIKKWALAVLVIAAGSTFRANAQEVISLQKAVDLALDRNLTIKQAKFTESLAAEDLKQSKYNLLPSASASPTAGWGFGRSPVSGNYAYVNQTVFNVNGSATVQFTLFQGGQLRNQILQNKLLLDVDKTSTAKIKNDLVLNVVTDYLQILTNQDLVTAAQQQIDIAKITLDRTQQSFDAGNLSLADLSQAKAGLSTAEYNLTTAQNQLDLSILVLKQYMEMDPNTGIKVERPDISKLNDIKTAYDPNEVIKTALSVNPDVKLAETQQQSYAQAIKVARGNYYPSISLIGNLNSYYSSAQQSFRLLGGTTPETQTIGVVDGTGQLVKTQFPVSSPIYGYYSFGNQFKDNFNQFVGVSLQIPIFNHFSARTSVSKAKLSYENAQVATQLAKNNLSKTITQAVLDLNAAVRRYASAQQTYQADKDAFNVMQERYNVGLVNSLDYNTSLTNYNKAQNDMIEAKYEVVFRSKVIDYYLGNTITL
ncbi:TolC family protein [Mucilaginibacter ginsenosidivorans]|uniref:TolC family protein n=1 Tax=Mucilaginibacter ginsenosidivorans TaxID=398053 RepID=A0A5B8UX77_9SPHI|nr:TolC family protein [Mucilaginibacter ginsenosidivorans]QEC62931.1 TolC family protein [Mucilaginibacter ginsenosidivorans]